MSFIAYRKNQLYIENCAIERLAEQFGTPCYLYSKAAIVKAWQDFNQALGSNPEGVCYAVKANSNLAVLNVLARLGSGFDIVSGGELARVLAAGGQAKNIIFSGVGKQEHELIDALRAGVGCFNVESIPELERLNAIAARLNKVAPIALRVNPDIKVITHPYITTGLRDNKFGIPADEALAAYRYASTLSNLHILGVASHIGSQITEIKPFEQAADFLLELANRLRADGIAIHHLDLGGGFAIPYTEQAVPTFSDYLKPILNKLKRYDYQVFFAPGRAIVAQSGLLITRVEYLKTTEVKNFAIIDAGMNDLLRPALYQAWQEIIPVHLHSDIKPQLYDVVGPVCETSDFIGKQRELAIQVGDYLAVQGAGAYGFVMSSNYNSRPRVAEVMIDGTESYLIRKRETYADLFANENLLP